MKREKWRQRGEKENSGKTKGTETKGNSKRLIVVDEDNQSGLDMDEPEALYSKQCSLKQPLRTDSGSLTEVSVLRFNYRIQF